MVEIRLESKRYNCTLKLTEKVTIIHGNNGMGKTELVRRLSSFSKANKVLISNGFSVLVLRYNDFDRICKSVGDIRNSAKLKEYWGIKRNFPYNVGNIILIDDEDFVRTKEFSILCNCDKYNYYVIINRGKITGISDKVYNFVEDGKEHYIERG